MKKGMSKVGRKRQFRSIIIAATFVFALLIPYILIKRLFPRDLKRVLELQNKITSEIDNVDIFKYSSEEEFLESMLIDCCYGLFGGKELVALCIGVMNRESPRNLCELLGSSDHVILDLTEASHYKVGGVVEFKLSYGALLSAFTSKYVGRRYED